MAFLPKLDIQQLFYIFAQIYDGLIKFWQVLGTPIGTLINSVRHTPVIQDVVDVLTDAFPDFFATSLFSFIAGSGILLFVVFTLVKWVLDIVT